MIAVANVLSRVVGFLRSLVLASEVGPNSFGEAYTSANTLPNVLFEVAAGGALASAVVPLLAVPLARSLRRDVDRTAGALLGWTLAVLLPLAAVVAAASRVLVGWFMPGASPAELETAATFLAIFAPQIPLYGVGLVLTGVLQAQRRFLMPALAPLFNSVVVISAFLVFGQLVPGPKDDPSAVPATAVAVLGWGTTAGVAAMSLPLLWPVWRSGVRLALTLHFPQGVARRARALAVAGVGALLAQQASVLATLALANRFGQDGTFPVFQLTQAVYFLPYAVLAFPLATAALPRLAEHAARGDQERFADLAAGTTRLVLVVAMLGASVLVAVAPAVEQVYSRFADGDVTGMGVGLAWMAPGVLGFALILHLSRALYSLDQGRSAVTATAVGWLVVAATAWGLVVLFTDGVRDQVATLRGLGLATSIGMTVAGGGLLLAVVRAAGRPAVSGLARTALALAAGGLGGAVAGRLAVVSLTDGDLVGGLVGGVVGGVVCAVVLLGAVWLADRSVFTAVRSTANAPGLG